MILYLKENLWIDTEKPLDISYPISASEENINAWYCNNPIIEPVRTEQFLGSVEEGGNVNFRNISFNPHGNGTHTECVGHISKQVYSINERLKTYFFTAILISVSPENRDSNDYVITENMLKEKIGDKKAESIVIRTLPNSGKKAKNYSNTNPPYLTENAMKYLVNQEFQHLLIDLPSVDKEFDEGKLTAHHIFWDYPKNENSNKTITELIYVPDYIEDGSYILNLMIAPFQNDASPSKPVLYKIFN